MIQVQILCPHAGSSLGIGFYEVVHCFCFISSSQRTIPLSNVLTSSIPSKTKLSPASHTRGTSRMASCHVHLQHSRLSDCPFRSVCFCHNGPSTPTPATHPLSSQSDPTGLDTGSLYGAATAPPMAVHLDGVDAAQVVPTALCHMDRHRPLSECISRTFSTGL